MLLRMKRISAANRNGSGVTFPVKAARINASDPNQSVRSGTSQRRLSECRSLTDFTIATIALIGKTYTNPTKRLPAK
jgi:hypothetical protein